MTSQLLCYVAFIRPNLGGAILLVLWFSATHTAEEIGWAAQR